MKKLFYILGGLSLLVACVGGIVVTATNIPQPPTPEPPPATEPMPATDTPVIPDTETPSTSAPPATDPGARLGEINVITSVYFRSAPEVADNVLGYFVDGDIVTLLECGEWVMIESGGVVGWVYGAYVSGCG